MLAVNTVMTVCRLACSPCTPQLDPVLSSLAMSGCGGGNMGNNYVLAAFNLYSVYYMLASAGLALR